MLASAMLLTASGVAAETLTPPPGVIVNPDWKRRPTAANLLSVYPTKALEKGMSGRATIRCQVTTAGALNRCEVVSEDPVEMGFGAAAVALAPQFLMNPAKQNGVPVTSTIAIPIQFRTFGGPSDNVASESKKILPPNLAWAEAPSYADVAAAYPAKAATAKLGGRATVACEMTEDGRLKACFVAGSDPRNYGFDVAAKALTKKFRLAILSDADRKATRSVVVHVPVAFDPAMLTASTPTVGKPSWAVIPNPEQLSSAFSALKIVGTVRVVMMCTVEQSGTLSGCSVESELPLGAGAGAAALGLTPSFRLSTWSEEGLPIVGGVVRIPIRYEGASVSPATPPAK